MSAIEVLEGILSAIVGAIAGIFIGIGFALGAVLRMIRYLAGRLIGMLIPSARPRIRLKWMLRDADRDKNAKLRLGMFRTAELTGGAADRLFLGVKRCMEQHRQHRLPPEAEAQYAAYLSLFCEAAESVDWRSESIWSAQEQPALPQMETALIGMEALFSQQ